MAIVRRSDNDYHLRVVSYCGDPLSSRFARKVDDLLEDLYNVGDLNLGVPAVPGHLNVPSPLAFSECRLSEYDGRQTALVKNQAFELLIKFQLSPSGARRLTLDEALAEFCEKIFKPDASSIARTLTRRSLLGLSAISGTFQRMWYDSLFRQVLHERETFLRRIEEGFDDEYLPDWALASSYASFTGVIFLTERDPSWNIGQITEASIADCITVATSILVNLSTRVELANPDLQQKRWDISHKKFKQDTERVMRTITQFTAQDNDRSNEFLYADLCEHLYAAMAAAAKTHIANRELFLEYVKLHKEAHASMIVNGALTGAYLASVSSAFSVTTTTAALPLSQWSLSQAAGWLFFAETPMIQTTTLWVCPPLFGLSIGAAAWFGWSRYQDKKKSELFAKKVDYHRKLKAFIVQAWKIAHLTHTLLRLVHCIGTDRMDVEFVNGEARSEWRDIITRFNEAGGRRTPRPQLEPRHIITFLDEQRIDFEAWREGLAAHEAQIV